MSKKKCFVLMPFTGVDDEKHETGKKGGRDKNYWDSFFETIKAEMEKHDYVCVRADSEITPATIMSSIVNNINDSDFAIAVLTDRNPNVFYELGVRHTLRNGTLMLIEEGQDFVFDVAAYQQVRYPADEEKLKKVLAERIPQYIHGLNGKKSNNFDSPVLETLGLPAQKKILIPRGDVSEKFEDVDVYTAKRIGQAKREVCLLTWQDDELRRVSYDPTIKDNTQITVAVGDFLRRFGTTCRELFTFSFPARIVWAKERMKNNNYQCRWYDNLELPPKRFPKLQFRIIDREEVILASRAHEGHICAIKDTDLAKAMWKYFDLAWTNPAAKLISHREDDIRRTDEEIRDVLDCIDKRIIRYGEDVKKFLGILE